MIVATLALAVVVWTAGAAAISLAVSVTWFGLRHGLRRLHPVTRARALAVTAIAPWGLATLLTLICFAPGMFGALGFVEDHCRFHPDHPHLCLTHPTAVLTPALVAVLVVVVCGLSVKLIADGARLRRSLDQARRLRRVAMTSLAPDVRLVESGRVFAVTAGLLRPSIFVSRGLVAALPEKQLQVVVAHERAHARRRDPLASLAAHSLSFPFLPPIRRAILTDLNTAVEQACDDEAGKQVADRLQVAEAILTVERLASSAGSCPASVPGFGGSSIPARVRNLVSAHTEPASPQFVWWALAIAVSAGIVWAGALHHRAEHLLSLLDLGH